MTRVKITGITNADDAATASEHGVDIVACVFYAGSPRYVTAETAWEIRHALAPGIPLVGVFVDTPTPLVQRVMDHCRLDAAQLFGSEQRSSVESLRPHAFKALNIAAPGELDTTTRPFLGRRTAGGKHPDLLVYLTDGWDGGWSAVAPLCQRAPVVVAGDKLTAETVGEAIVMGKPWGVDVWTAVESEPGHLDAERLRDFVAAARDADAVSLGDGADGT